MSLPDDWRIGRSEDEIREIERLLYEAEAGFTANPLAKFRPNSRKQHRYLAAEQFTKVYCGANGAGKSHIGTADDLIQLLDVEWVPEHLRQYKRWEPPFHMRVVIPKFNIVDSSTLEKFRELTPPGALRGDSFDKAYDKQARKLHFKNGSWVLFNSSDQEVSAHAAVELHRVRFDEEPEGEHGYRVFNENVMRLRSANPGQVCFTFTPQNGFTWTYDGLWEKRGPEIEPDVFEDDDLFLVQVSIFDNPNVDGEAFVAKLNLPPEEAAARIHGKFISFHGLVLKNFREQEDADGKPPHVVTAPTQAHVQRLETLVVIDPGISRAAALWAGMDKDNIALIYDELYPENADVPTMAKLIKDKNREWGVTPDIYIIDPSARNRNLATGETIEDLFQRENIPVVPGHNQRRASILELRARIQADALLVSETCRNWLMERNRWVVAKDETTDREKRTDGDTFATKGPDHLMDCSRMLALERMWYPDPTPTNTAQYMGPGTAPPAAFYNQPTRWDVINQL